MDFPRCGSGEEVSSVSGILDDRLCPNPFSDAGGRWIGKITGGRTHASAGQIVWACHRHRADHRGRARCDAMARRCGCGHACQPWRGDEPARSTAPVAMCSAHGGSRTQRGSGIAIANPTQLSIPSGSRRCTPRGCGRPRVGGQVEPAPGTVLTCGEHF